MLIGSINNPTYFGNANYSNYTNYPSASYPNASNNGKPLSPFEKDKAGKPLSPLSREESDNPLRINGKEDEDSKKKNGKVSPEECETCKKRKYVDGSDEANVSFKSAAHLSPEAAGAAVRGHEAEHVKNAYNKAEKGNGKVINTSVSIHTAVCPECGRTYVSGGTTNTQIKYYNESNPYQKNMKSSDSIKYRGANVDYVA